MQQIHSIVLAAGLSKRMGSINTNKVCFKLLGVPAVCRVIEALESAGIVSHTAVVGARAAEVQSCLNQYCPDKRISYAFQKEQLGPADALYCAVRSLPAALSPDTLLLVIPGHRIVSDRVVEQLVEFYRSRKLKLAGVQLVDEQGKLVQRLSIYLGKLGDIAAGLNDFYAQLARRDEEISLTALADVMNGSSSDTYMSVDDFTQVMSFNDPEEYLKVTEILRRKQGETPPGVSASEYHPARAWLDALNDKSSELFAALSLLYGGDKELIERQHGRITNLINAAIAQWGAEMPLSLVRSPGRVNIMGRHVDHQGGTCNLMTIGYETLMAARIRPDDKVTLVNLETEFAPAEFRIGELVRDLPWNDWQELIASKKLAQILRYGVSWSDYIKAVFLRFQKLFYEKKLHGMDIIVGGNVPMAVGLSSSSALVVAAAVAVVGANRLDLEPDKLITLCGESEWFVGTRGGSADHAAVKMGECNKVVKVGFFDLKVEEMVDFPSDYALIVGDSHIKARKSSNAKDRFNHRISCYRIGLLLLKKLYPQYANVLHHLRDFNCKNLNIPLDWLYKLLLALPEKATRRELEAMLPETDLSIFWNNHAEPADGIYPIRGTVIYGLAECARSARFVEYLAGDIRQAGEMMNISHNGDRVHCFDAKGNSLGEYFSDTSDQTIKQWIKDLQSSDPERIERAQLWRQPGSYQCSLPDIDLMVDLACGVPGVVGAQLAGAGLGGCMMILVRKDAIGELTRVLTEKYYQPRNLTPRLLHCRPIAGAGAVKWQ